MFARLVAGGIGGQGTPGDCEPGRIPSGYCGTGNMPDDGGHCVDGRTPLMGACSQGSQPLG